MVLVQIKGNIHRADLKFDAVKTDLVQQMSIRGTKKK